MPAMLADTELLFRQARQGHAAFAAAAPFPHVLLPGMIKANCRVALCEGLREWRRQLATGALQSAPYPHITVPSVVHLLLWELSSSTLIRHLASLSGTPPLLPDPFLHGGGPVAWTEESTEHSSAGDFFARHPHTGLQNRLRLEIFLAEDPAATFPLELVGPGAPSTYYAVANGSGLLVPSDNYRMVYRSRAPQQWCSFICYFYVNDQARILNGEEQPRAY